MPIVLVATPGSASANTYALVADVTALAETLLPVPTAWGAAGTDVQARACVTATRLLDRLAWVGDRASTTQALAWPRYGAQTADGVALDSDVIPQPLQHATARLAIWLVQQDEDPESRGDLDGLSALSLGSGVSFGFTSGGPSGSPFDAFLRDVLRPMLAGLARTGQPRAVRG